MKKFWVSFALCCSLFAILVSYNASAQAPIDIKILSPKAIENYPGFETNVQVEITNVSNAELKSAMAYITMADIGKHMTVNLEDYGADVPVRLKNLKPHESIKVTLPIRFVYTSNYKLYVTVSSDENLKIYSSESIPVHILGNTKINPLIVQIVSISVPIILLILLLVISKRKKLN